MNFITTDKKCPKDEEWYIVYCPDYCESQYAIAQWNDEYQQWHNEGLSSPINDYVRSYFPNPTTEF